MQNKIPLAIKSRRIVSIKLFLIRSWLVASSVGINREHAIVRIDTGMQNKIL